MIKLKTIGAAAVSAVIVTIGLVGASAAASDSATYDPSQICAEALAKFESMAASAKSTVEDVKASKVSAEVICGDGDSNIQARVRVLDTICVKLDVTRADALADAKIIVPCHRPFKNCDEARAAGRHDIVRDSRYYASHLDSDNDGIACEIESVVTSPVKEAEKPRTVVADLPVTH